MPRLLVIDDRDHTVEMCHRHLGQFDYVTRCERRIPCQVCEERDRGCRLKCAHDYFEAAATLSRLDALPDLVVLDLHFAVPEERLLPEDKSALPSPADTARRKRALEQLRRRQGLLILERLRRDYPRLPVVLLTTTETEIEPPLVADPNDAAAAQADAPRSKTRWPMVYFCANEIVDSRSLASEITRALELHHETAEGPIFWGQSAAMAELRRQLGTLARSPLPVLLQGETGTGKSFLAEYFIHPRSGAKGPLVVTDLSTVPAALLPAHLLGARRGAYTGAVEDHPGVFEQAHGGTLFLDEVANLDLDLQRQLLLVLERGQVTRLGDVRPRPAQVKLVAATHEDLPQLVGAGRFRADLYMRLNPAMRLHVPPLRERREDLPELVRFALLDALRSPALGPLVRAFLARFPTPEDFREERSVVLFGRPSGRAAAVRRDAFSVFVSQKALNRLIAHRWPGNLRELKMLATNALCFTLAEQLEAALPAQPEQPASGRAPAVLTIPDELVERMLLHMGSLLARPPAQPARSAAPASAAAEPSPEGRRVEIQLRTGPSFGKVSVDVERQYFTALFHAVGGDLEQMGRELLGEAGAARKVHMRLNQLGVQLRELRK